MSFTFDTDTAIGKVRREIGDRDDASLTAGSGVRPNGENYPDEDISYYLSQTQGSVGLASISMLTILAIEFSTKAQETEYGPVRESHKATVLQIRSSIRLLQDREDQGKKTATSSIKSTNERIEFFF